MKTLHVTNRDEWRDWLSKHHAGEREIWLIYYKKHTGQPRIPYDDAVEEALCYGWIDSTVRRIDDEKYAQKFTPRNDKSNWSEPNKKRVSKLIKAGRMTEVGMAKIRAAKKLGTWHQIPASKIAFDTPPEFTAALKSNRKAKKNFDNLAPSSQKQYIAWIASAKRAETREKRILESMRLLEDNEKLGMK